MTTDQSVDAERTSESSHPHIKIGALARMTGLSPHTIRKWEQRYNAVCPQRGPNGQRLYSQSEVERLRRLKQLTEAGHSIGAIAALPLEALEATTRTLSDEHALAEPMRFRTVLVGATLRAVVEPMLPLTGTIELVCAHDSIEALMQAGIPRSVDFIVVEQTVVDAKTGAALVQLRDKYAAVQVVVVYSFSTATRLAELRALNMIALRAPVDAEGLERALVASRQRGLTSAQNPPTPAPQRSKQYIETEEITVAQLAHLARQQPRLGCECPRHLVNIILTLRAFEEYNSLCAVDNPEDAALHEALQETVSRSRVTFERALSDVARHDGLSLHVDS